MAIGSLNMHKDDADFSHSSVLLPETLSVIGSSKCGLVIDATLGLGGHTQAMLESSDDVKVIGIDQDEAAIASLRAAGAN